MKIAQQALVAKRPSTPIFYLIIVGLLARILFVLVDAVKVCK